MKRVMIFILFFIIAFSSYSRNFVIAGIPEEPNRWAGRNGIVQGIDVDIIDFIMKKMEIKYEIVLVNSSARLIQNSKIKNSPYDMVFTYSYNKEREQYLTFAKESHIEFEWNFFIRKEDAGKYKFEKYEDLTGVRIGATQGMSYSDEFWRAYKNNILSLDITQKNEVQIKKLLNRRIDMVPLNTKAALYEAREKGYTDKIAYLPKEIKRVPYYNTFVKNSSYPGMDYIMKKYDKILKEMKADGTLEKIYKKYGFEYTFKTEVKIKK